MEHLLNYVTKPWTRQTLCNIEGWLKLIIEFKDSCLFLVFHVFFMGGLFLNIENMAVGFFFYTNNISSTEKISHFFLF
jgi:hypothetical protein